MSDAPDMPDVPPDPEAATAPENSGGAEAPPEAAEPQLPQYIIEGARSSRSKCKTCRRKIDKGVLRIGVLVEGPYGVGHMWHHLKCAAKRRWDDVAEAYRLEAWNDAKEPPAKVPSLDQLETQREKAEQQRKERKTIPYLELDPSGRAKCKHCGESLEKGKLRAVMGRTVEFGNQVRLAPVNVHPRCVGGELEHPECGIEPQELIGGLRANSGELEGIEQAIAEIGDVG